MSQFLINTDWFCSFRSFKLYQRKKRKGDCCGNNPKLSENKMCVFWVDPPTFSHLHILFMLKMTIDYIKINCMTTILYMSSTTLVLLCWYHVSIPVAVPTMKSKVCFSLWYLIQYDTTETTGICISITGAHIHAMPQTLHSCTHTALNSVWLRPTPTPLCPVIYLLSEQLQQLTTVLKTAEATWIFIIYERLEGLWQFTR